MKSKHELYSNQTLGMEFVNDHVRGMSFYELSKKYKCSPSMAYMFYVKWAPQGTVKQQGRPSLPPEEKPEEKKEQTQITMVPIPLFLLIALLALLFCCAAALTYLALFPGDLMYYDTY